METPISDLQLIIVLNDLLDIYGYDFTAYVKSSLKRRINRFYALDRFPSFAEFRYRLRIDQDYFNRFIEQLTVNVTEMFRDPLFYKAILTEVLPVLVTK